MVRSKNRKVGAINPLALIRVRRRGIPRDGPCLAKLLGVLPSFKIVAVQHPHWSICVTYACNDPMRVRNVLWRG